MGKSRLNCWWSPSELETEIRSGTWAKRFYIWRLLSGCRAPLTKRTPCTGLICPVLLNQSINRSPRKLPVILKNIPWINVSVVNKCRPKIEMLDGGRQRCNSDLEGSAAIGLRWQRHHADVLSSSHWRLPGLTRGTHAAKRSLSQPHHRGDKPCVAKRRRLGGLKAPTLIEASSRCHTYFIHIHQYIGDERGGEDMYFE